MSDRQLMIHRCFRMKGKYVMKARNKRGVGSGGHVLFLGGKAIGLIPWQQVGGTSPPFNNRKGPLMSISLRLIGPHLLFP